MRKWLATLAVLMALTVFSEALPAAPSPLPYAAAEAAQQPIADMEGASYSEEPIPDILLVNPDHALPEDYEPTDLVDLYKIKKRPFKMANTGIYIERHAYEAMNEMFTQAKADGVKNFIITSGYRTAKQQKKIYKSDKDDVAAKPGHSEHQTGLAFDVTATNSGGFQTTKQFRWLSEHCWEYGFILRYPKGGKKITGIRYEPWHYRYVGVEHALKMRDSGQTLEEYLSKAPQVEMSFDEEQAS